MDKGWGQGVGVGVGEISRRGGSEASSKSLIIDFDVSIIHITLTWIMSSLTLSLTYTAMNIIQS